MKLSEQLGEFRTGRPDEQTMDSFIREAVNMENLLGEHHLYASTDPRYLGSPVEKRTIEILEI